MSDELARAVARVGEYLGEYVPAGEWAALWRQVEAGEWTFDWRLPGRLAAAVCAQELGSALALLGELLVLAVFAMMVSGLAEGSVGRLAGCVMGLAAAVPAVRVLLLCGECAGEAVDLMSDFLYALLPVLMTLLASMGGAGAVALYNPMLLFAVGVSLHLLRQFVLPMLYVSGALAVGNRLPGGLKMGGLAKLVRDVAAGVFGLMLAVFGGVLGVVGVATACLNGLGWRAAKVAGSTFIPVVGRTLADALDSVVSTALLVKNVVGLAGILVLGLICILPGVKILLMYVAIRLAGALAEPLGNADLAGLLGDIAQVVALMFGVVAAAGLFFFFLISITIGMGNVMMALR